MYAAIRRGKANPGSVSEVARRLQDGIVPTLRNLPGFVAYYFVNLGNDEGMSITVFETRDAAEESNQLSVNWARQNLADIISPLFFISVQSSLPEVKPKEESPDSPLTSDTQANRAEEARV